MESFFSEHWQLALAAIAALVSFSIGLSKREFNMIQRHQEKQDGRLDVISSDVSAVVVDLADSKRDRRGLHGAMAQHFQTVKSQLEAVERSNTEAHASIVRLIQSKAPRE